MDPRQRLVSEIMRTEIATLSPGERLDLADDVMKLGRVRHMPVVEGTRLVGMVSSRDLLEASLSKALDFDATSRRTFLRSIEVSEVMAKDVVSVAPDATLSDAAEILIKRRIGALPVVRPDGTLIGLLTETDLVATALLGEADTGSDAPGFGEWLRGELDDVRRIRDEVQVKVHLGKAELRDQWEALEAQFEKLERRVKNATRAAGEPLEDLREDARRVIDDLREGFRRLRSAL